MPQQATPSSTGLSIADIVAAVTILSAGDQTNFNNLVQQTIPATTIAVASNGATLPTGTIFVASVTSFPLTGTLWIEALATSVTYTGVSTSPPSFTGCSNGSGGLTTGMAIQQGAPNLTMMRLANLLALVASYPGLAVLAANQTFTGQNTFDAEVTCASGAPLLCEGNLYVGSGHNLLTAGVCQIGGLTATPIGSTVWGKLLCTANSSAEFDGAVTVADTLDIASGATATIDSGATLDLAAGSTFTATTAVSSAAVAIVGSAGSAHNFTVDCSTSNTFVYDNLDASEATYTWALTNTVSGYRGRIYFLMPTIVSPSIDLTLSGSTVITWGSGPSLTAGKWYYWDFAVAAIGGTTFLFRDEAVESN